MNTLSPINTSAPLLATTSERASGSRQQDGVGSQGSTFAISLGQAMAEQASAQNLSFDMGVDLTTGGLNPTSSGTVGQAPAAWISMFQNAGAKHGIDPALLMAVAETESNFNAGAVSPAGAQGLMQFMPATAAEMGVDPFDPASAIDGAARYLADGMDRFGRADLAIAAYNAGAGAVRRHGGIPPYAETQNYVQKVMRSWEART